MTTANVTITETPVTVTLQSNGGIPADHAASHAAAGGDPITIAQSQVTDLTSDLAGKLATPGAWTSYTPALSGWSLGNGTVTGAYVQVGKIVHFRARINFGSTTSFAGGPPRISVPVAIIAGSQWPEYRVLGMAYDVSVSNLYPIVARTWDANSYGCYTHAAPAASLSSSVPFTWASGDYLSIYGTYETSA
jgi:hypothetical protein